MQPPRSLSAHSARRCSNTARTPHSLEGGRAVRPHIRDICTEDTECQQRANDGGCGSAYDDGKIGNSGLFYGSQNVCGGYRGRGRKWGDSGVKGLEEMEMIWRWAKPISRGMVSGGIPKVTHSFQYTPPLTPKHRRRRRPVRRVAEARTTAALGWRAISGMGNACGPKFVEYLRESSKGVAGWVWSLAKPEVEKESRTAGRLKSAKRTQF
ncbi:hypothetical protein C8J57DRAFT_1470196 [Mycena rebaudengoi]|nr:hypothetical protein C8J57DRAFT_1470196 [Mycena rebaudengoi]